MDTQLAPLTPQTDSPLILSSPLPLDQHPAAVFLAGLRAGSRPTMRGALDAIAGLLTGQADAFLVDWAKIRYQHAAAVRSRLEAAYAPATANKMLSALRGALREAWNLGLMTGEDYHRAKSVKIIEGETLLSGRALTSGEIAALMKACEKDPTPAGVRDAAMIALLRACGLRRAEICALELADYTPADGLLVVHGKRHKDRTAYVTNGAFDALADWLIVRGNEAGALFCPVKQSGEVVIRRMFAEAVFNLLRKRSKEAGIEASLSPHDFRRTFVTDLLEAGADISTVQQLAGHSRVTTTQRYDRRGEAPKIRAAKMLHVPYHKRKQ